jgi:cytoskeletal protein RodZ
MDTPGNVLRAEREYQKKSLKEIARSLKLNIDFLKAIEEDDYSLLPAEVFTKAYLRIYAESLGIENGYILNLYKTLMEEGVAVKSAPPSRGIDFTPLKNIFQRTVPWKPLAVIAVFVLIILFAITLRKPEEQKSIDKVVNKTEETSIMEEETTIIEENKQGTLSLKIIAIELTWVSVSIDDGKPTESLLRTGESITVTAVSRFAVKVGNAGGTRLILNNRDVGSLGPRGKVVDIVLP